MPDLHNAYIRQRRRGLNHHEAIETLAVAHDTSMLNVEQQIEAQYREDRPDDTSGRDWRRPRLRRKKVSQ